MAQFIYSTVIVIDVAIHGSVILVAFLLVQRNESKFCVDVVLFVNVAMEMSAST